MKRFLACLIAVLFLFESVTVGVPMLVGRLSANAEGEDGIVMDEDEDEDDLDDEEGEGDDEDYDYIEDDDEYYDDENEDIEYEGGRL